MPLNYTNKNHSEQKRFSHFRSFFWVFRAEHRSSIGIFQALFFRLFEVETRKMVSAVVPLWRQLIEHQEGHSTSYHYLFALLSLLMLSHNPQKFDACLFAGTPSTSSLFFISFPHPCCPILNAVSNLFLLSAYLHIQTP